MSKYVPNLLPNHPELDIDGELIINSKKSQNKGNNIFQTISYILAILIFISSVALFSTRFWQGLLLLTIGFLVLPLVHKFIERKLRFKFKTLPKTIVCLTIFFFSLFIGDYYQKQETETAEIEKNKKEKEQIAKKEAEKIEKERIDSLSMFQNSAIEYLNDNKLNDANNSIQVALRLSKKNNEKNKSNSIYADYLFKSRKYSDAIETFSSLIGSNYNLSNTYYKRAICYQKINKIQEAVEDLREAIKLGNDEANQLHDKINPIKKKIVGYTTLCCDGTTSTNRGRGACSGHGGVCNWNHPIYEKYRQY